MNADQVAEQLKQNKFRPVSSETNELSGNTELVIEQRGLSHDGYDDIEAAVKLLATIDSPLAGTPFARTGTWTVTKRQFVWEDEERRDKWALVLTLFSGSGSNSTVVTENSCRYQVSTRWFWDVGSVAAAPSSDPNTGTTYRIGGVSRDNDTGLFDYYLETSVRLYQTIDTYVSQNSDGSSTSTTVHLGVSDNKLATLTIPTSADAGTILSVDKSRNEDCTQDITIKVTTPAPQSALDYVQTDARSITITKTFEGVEQAAPAQVDGTIQRVENTPTEAGNFNSSVHVEVVNPQRADDYVKTAARTISVVKRKEDSAQTEPSSPSAGTIVRVDQTPTESGMFDSSVSTETVIPQGATDYVKTSARTITVTKKLEDAAVSAPTKEVGHIKRVEQSPTESGKYNSSSTDEEVIEQEGSGVVISAAKTVSTVSTKEGDFIDPDAIEPPEPGTIVRVDNRPTEAGKYDTEEVTEIVNEQSTHDAVISAARTITVAKKREGDEVDLAAIEVDGDVVEQEPGVIIRVDQVPTESGKYDSQVSVEQVVDQEATDLVLTGARVARTVKHTESDEVPVGSTDPIVDTWNPGTIIRVEQSKTESGLVQSSVTTEAVKDQATDDQAVTHSYIEKAERHTENSESKSLNVNITTGTSDNVPVGEVWFADNTPTESGLTQTRYVRRKAKKQEFTVTWDTKYGPDIYYYGEHLTDAEKEAKKTELADAGRDVSMSGSKDEFGLNTLVISSRSRASAGSVGLWTDGHKSFKKKIDGVWTTCTKYIYYRTNPSSAFGAIGSGGGTVLSWDVQPVLPGVIYEATWVEASVAL
jgi:hypothetical protein